MSPADNDDPLSVDLAAPLLDRVAAEAGAAEEGAAEEGAAWQPHGATVPQTIGLILSIYVGLGLLSQPYAVRLGGWAALAVLALTIALFSTSALLLPKAFDLLPPGTAHSYPELGAAALGGRRGRALVAALAALELFGSLAIALVVVYTQIELLLPPGGVLGLSPLSTAVALTSAALLPALAARDVARLAPLAMAGSAASLVVVAAVLALPVLDPHRAKLAHQPPAPHHAAKFPGALQSMGIFAVSASGHSCLPALRGAMREPRRFPAAVLAAFACMGVVYGAVAGVGYWYWGDAVSAVIAVDLGTDSPFAPSLDPGGGGSGGGGGWRHWAGVDRLIAALVLTNCASKVPALVMVVQELLAGLALAAGAPPTPRWRFCCRLGVAGGAVALSWAAREALGTVLGLVGGACSMATSLLLPVAFYASLTWRSQPATAKAAVGALGGAGAALLVLVTALNVRQVWFGGGGWRGM